ncbi:MAG TPA: hypothetical protein VGN17_19805 [Bryobacteraceae bacterium]|jgi:hypothetical protein
MPLRRKILASLAPLLGLSAIIAAMAAQPGEATLPPPRTGISSLVQLLRSVAQLAAPDVEYSTARTRSVRRSPQAALALSALVATPFHSSVWMLARYTSPAPLPPHLKHAPLRC